MGNTRLFIAFNELQFSLHKLSSSHMQKGCTRDFKCIKKVIRGRKCIEGVIMWSNGLHGKLFTTKETERKKNLRVHLNIVTKQWPWVAPHHPNVNIHTWKHMCVLFQNIECHLKNNYSCNPQRQDGKKDILPCVKKITVITKSHVTDIIDPLFCCYYCLWPFHLQNNLRSVYSCADCVQPRLKINKHNCSLW